MMFLKSLKEQNWQEFNCGMVKGWQCKELLKFPSLKHLFTSKSGDLNLGKHAPYIFPEKSAEKNRETLCKSIELSYGQLKVLPLSHSNDVSILEESSQQLAECDAVITRLKSIPLLITAADCVPILLYAPEKNILGIVHAGWRGTAGRIVEKTVIAMQENYLVRPSQIIAAIGPAIGQNNYEVSDEVARALVDSCESDSILETSGTKPKVDLKKTNQLQLDNAGVMKIFISELDTASQTSLFYSHRMQGKRAGRQGLIACLV